MAETTLTSQTNPVEIWSSIPSREIPFEELPLAVNVTAAPEQTVWSVPASTVGKEFTVTST